MIRVLIVDDSVLVRETLKNILSQAKDIQIVGTASDPLIARDKFRKLKPDVITLDIEMPRMTGLSFLEKLMIYKPTPVIMISSLTQKGAKATFKAMELGAIDVVAKPNGQFGFGLEEMGAEIIQKIRTASRAKLRTTKKTEPYVVDRKIKIDELLAYQPQQTREFKPVICIGASTGGTVAIDKIIHRLPPTLPGIVMVQHMPPGFTKSFAEHLNQKSHLQVMEAMNGQILKRGMALLAPGGKHMILQKSHQGYAVKIKDGPRINRHRPSVDVLFRSAANVAGKNALGVILTGMGDDGARGLKDLFKQGAFTIAESKESCVVYGMPKVAVDMGGVTKSAHLLKIPQMLISKS